MQEKTKEIGPQDLDPKGRDAPWWASAMDEPPIFGTEIAISLLVCDSAEQKK
jgi:hypothetical protein